METESLAPARLLERVRECSAAALASGALEPLPTRIEWLQDDGLPFAVRVLTGRSRKPSADAPQRDDPFAPPYERDVYVGDLASGHAAVLNKFNVLADHLLLVTRHWEPQDAPLTQSDFHALLLGLAGMDGLAFYNGGRVAGASQRHKHLQVVPLPLAEGGPELPLAPALQEAGAVDTPVQAPRLPFPHAICAMPDGWTDDPARAAELVKERYHALWHHLGHNSAEPERDRPYNLLATHRWLWLVPRSRETWEGISVNGLGFAGSLVVGGRGHLERLQQTGPLRVLAHVVE